MSVLLTDRQYFYCYSPFCILISVRFPIYYYEDCRPWPQYRIHILYIICDRIENFILNMLTRTALSRVLLLRNFRNVANTLKQNKRNSGHGSWAYRVPPAPASRKETLLAEGLGGLCWWWILWHILTEPEHITGEWPYVPPSTWTDEELGIPPDSDGPLKN